MLKEEEINELMNDLYLFYRVFITSNFTDDVDAEHIDKLSQYLTALHLGDFNRLCVAMPPRHSKSSMVTLAFPLWLIFQNPNLNILIINNAATLSEKFGIQLKEFIRQHGHYFNVYLSDLKHAKDHLMFERNDGKLCKGSIRLVGANGSITGQDADYIIIDDPYKGFDDITPTLLQKKIDWFDTIVEQRIEPHTKLCLLHTRWHSHDLQGYFKENRSSDYEFIEFAAIQKNGEPLWPEKYTIENLEKKRASMGERLFQSIFQQEPIDDTSDFFELQKIHWNKPEMGISNSVRGWDIASSEPGKNDWTAGVKMHLLDDGISVLITDIVHGQFGASTKNHIQYQTAEDGIDVIQLIETGVAAAGKLLFQEWQDQLTGYFIEQAIPITSKVDRATPFQNAILDGNVYVDIEDDELRQTFMKELSSFPNGEHDDLVDATSHAYNYIKNNFIGAVTLEIIEL